jgi:anti-sigma B factor antagonist
MSFSYTITNQSPSVAIITLEGNLMEKYEAADLLGDVDAQVDTGCINFILDFEQLKFLSSSGLGVILGILTRSRRNNGDVVLLNVTDKLKSLLTITRLDHVFSTAQSVSDAMKSFGNNSTNN